MKIASCLKATLVILPLLLALLLLLPSPQGLQAHDLGQFPHPPDLFAMGLNLDRLAGAHFIKFPEGGVEDVAVDSKGNIYTAAGPSSSSIYMISPSNMSLLNLIARNEGQVLGICLSPDETKLALADQSVGVRLLDLKTGNISTLVSEYGGVKFVSVNSITFSDEENIYFTAEVISMKTFHLETLSKGPTGRIYHHNIKSGETKLFRDKMRFPNGIAYSKKDNCLYVNHLNMYEVIRIPLSADSEGYEVVASNLPGYPDNLKITEGNKLWVAIPALRDSTSNLIDNNPLIRKAIINLRIPITLFMLVANMSLAGAIKIDPKTGKIEDYVFGKPDQISFVTGAYQRGNRLYLSSLLRGVIAVVDI